MDQDVQSIKINDLRDKYNIIIPEYWDLKGSDKLLIDASNRGYYFSCFYNKPIEQRKICLHCGGMLNPKPNTLNCICHQNIKRGKHRRMIRNIMFFVHEILLQNSGELESMPSDWPGIIIQNTEDDDVKRLEKRISATRLRGYNYKNGAFSLYMKNSLLEQFAFYLEDIVLDMLKIS